MVLFLLSILLYHPCSFAAQATETAETNTGSAKPVIETEAKAASALAPASVLALGDEAFKKRADKENSFRALDLYRDAYAKYPNDFETAWRVAAGCYHIGFRHTKDDGEKAKIFDEGKKAAEHGVAINPKCAACHFWAAINSALYGEAKGKVKMFFSIGTIRDHLEKTLELDPKYAAGGAYRLLGQIEMGLPGLLGGSNSKSKEYILKAIEMAPQDPINYYWITKLLNNKMSKPDEAKVWAEKGAKLPEPAPDQMESIDCQGKLKTFLAEGGKVK